MKMLKRNRRLAKRLRREGRQVYRVLKSIEERYDCGTHMLSEIRPDYPLHAARLNKIVRVLKQLERRGIHP